MYQYLKEIKIFKDNEVQDALYSYIELHNNSKKRNTKFSPIEIRDISDNSLIQQISQNIIKSIRYHINKDDGKLEKNEKLLLWDNLIFTIFKY